MARRSGVAVVFMSLVLGAGLGATAGGCGEDRDGSVEIEGGTTGTTGTGTVGTTETSTTGTTTTP